MFLDISEAFDLQTRTKWNIRKTFKYNKRFLKLEEQTVVLKGQYSSLTSITARVSRGWILGFLFFLIYIKDLPKSLSSSPRLFADETLLFSAVYNLNTSANNLDEDMKKIND